ncbi:MAG: cation-translocating P-type ATPase [bacterium]
MRKGTVQAETIDLKSYAPSALACVECRERIERALSEMSNVERTFFDRDSGVLSVQFLDGNVPLGFEENVRNICRGMTEGMTHDTLVLSGLDCPDCAQETERMVRGLKGVGWAGATFTTSRLHVEYDPNKISIGQITRAIGQLGYVAHPENERTAVQSIKLFPRLYELIFSGLLIAAGWASVHFKILPTYNLIPYLLGAFIAGYPSLRSAIAGIRYKAITMNTLMTIAVIGAASLGQWTEAASVAWLFAFGNSLQSMAIQRTRRALERLIAITPATARVITNGEDSERPIGSISAGDMIEVRPGERVPLDGQVIEGASNVDQSALTGESLPVDKEPGDSVYAGSLNGEGVLRFTVLHPYGETTLARVIHLFEEAQAKRAPAQHMIDRFAAYYTPLVVLLAILITAVPTLLFHQPFQPWFFRALWLLIVACPCALIISTPVAIITAIGLASRRGILIKGGAYLEAFASSNAILFDKTGTLTHAKISVDKVIPLNGYDRKQVISLAASLEESSEHPLADAVRNLAKLEEIPIKPVNKFQIFPGRGLEAEIDGQMYRMGNKRLLDDPKLKQLLTDLELDGKTAIALVNQDHAIGCITFTDTAREDAKSVLDKLKRQGVKHVGILSGDNEVVTSAFAEKVGSTDFFGDLLPQQKQIAVEDIRAKWGTTTMIGDGINDVLALQSADVAIAMGAIGSDAAVESADIVLLNDKINLIPELLNLSRQMMMIMRQNIWFSLSTKLALIIAAFFGAQNLWLAVAGDMGVSLIVTLNALRMRWPKETLNNCSSDHCSCSQGS